MKTRRTKASLLVHAFQPDGVTNHRGEHGCAHCVLPQRHPVHDVPPLPDGAAEVDARRLGEQTEGDPA